jgi:hypothetical protein
MINSSNEKMPTKCDKIINELYPNGYKFIHELELIDIIYGHNIFGKLLPILSALWSQICTQFDAK